MQIDHRAAIRPARFDGLAADAASSRAQPHYTDPNLPATQLARLVESMRVVNEMTLELIRDVPIEAMLQFPWTACSKL